MNRYESGDNITLFRNQGDRDAWVLGTLGDQMIIEYEMPSGTTALNILMNRNGADYVRSVSYTSCPKIWIKAIEDGVGCWEGISQGVGLIRFPEGDRRD